jgi:asparagine synthase (glutamine-hydrolysing)
MCGISGIYNFTGIEINESILNKINDTLYHRGPDNGNTKIWGNVGLCHRRLSIIDLSESANQPMSTEDGRFTIVFNGEIYNFLELKRELKNLDIKFITNSDTEVVLKSYQEWGVKCFSKLNGMFALAIYDNQKKELIIARDQFGIKPLYFYKNSSFFIFASEMKAILAHPDVQTSINKQGLVEYIWYGNPLGNNTIYSEIKELDAGCYAHLTNDKFSQENFFKIQNTKEIDINEKDAIAQIKYLLDISIKRHLISDVPVGIFLSGGIDSSAITAIASKYYNGTLNTYSVGFDFIKGPNELQTAASIAKKFRTNHHEIHISGKNIIQSIEALVSSHDEPFGDAADIPLYLLTKQLNNEIKVVLQGDGGDEFFGGYSIYNTMSNVDIWKKLSFLSKVITFIGSDNSKLLRLQRFLDAISDKNPAFRNAKLLTIESNYSNPLRIFNSDFRNELVSINQFQRYEDVYDEFPKHIDEMQAIFYSDAKVILKDTFFEKVDKSTMANSIEVRVPFLDKNLTEFMLSVPASLKVKNGTKKYLLKKALEGTIPNNILYGKKTGFSVPYSYWLKTTLSDYFIEQISTPRVLAIIDSHEVKRIFYLHKEGRGNFGFLLWKTLILAVWINKNTSTNLNFKGIQV